MARASTDVRRSPLREHATKLLGYRTEQHLSSAVGAGKPTMSDARSLEERDVRNRS